MQNSPASAAKFDPSRAGEYAEQSRIGLAGYDACHELAACVLASVLGSGSTARILVAGAGGTASEIVCGARLEPGWRFLAVDPSEPMLALARAAVEGAGFSERTEFRQAQVGDLSREETFDAATLIGVLHHLPGEEAKRAILADLSARLKPGAPLILAGNYRAYAEEPVLLQAWGQRWRQHGADENEVTAKLGKILQGADPPASEEVVADLLAGAGFEPPLRFFSSLFWGAWVTRKR
ncbi:class I SAM-dependent methyltransferase [Breoghania sp. JC706]|uniref:SAM-dependent methyltransferase n=1 Tax=Breoghania sp. JC706 TaxID=3117732 RepID=UPI00300A6A06